MKKFSCPMHPEVQEEKEGLCPKCGMKLQEEKGQEQKEGHKSCC